VEEEASSQDQQTASWYLKLSVLIYDQHLNKYEFFNNWGQDALNFKCLRYIRPTYAETTEVLAIYQITQANLQKIEQEKQTAKKHQNISNHESLSHTRGLKSRK